ncbi:Na+/H+ antiporter subunit E [Chloroflexi bacterium TSY]|nr:Na+/H+ antiporter subunit E [Chloroflexi bacterium TSY]
MMKRHTPGQQPVMLILFLINVVLAFIWSTFIALFPGFDFAIGLLIGFLGLGLYRRSYVVRGIRLIGFVLFVLWEILVSNFVLAWTIIQPSDKLNERLDPGIVAIPLSVDSDLEIIILATVITLTPGTLSVDLGRNDAGERLLYVHNLSVENVDTFRKSIKEGFERRILQITQGSVT